MYPTPPDKIMRSTKLFPHPALQKHDGIGIITPWRDIIAVLSAWITRTGPWGVGAPHGLPPICFQILF